MINKEKIEEGVRLLLEGIGEDVNREGLKDTPERVARMYEEIYSGYGAIENGGDAENLKKTFSVQDSELVLERDITFYSMCEHHMLPFYGKVHIAYVPDGKVVGLSKLARTVEVFARKLQVQEKMTGEIADAIMEHLSPKGVLIIAEAEHMCMTMRGIKKPGSTTVTCAGRGVFKDNEALCDRILTMLKI
ncbi:MAG: GTP cyclohydrolase I FolE [Lachnospiraceae bacterium]|nr:GTP cyclohydrolase I FolE [Lachnospiraceae bacterium]